MEGKGRGNKEPETLPGINSAYVRDNYDGGSGLTAM